MDIAPGRILIVISIHAPREGSDSISLAFERSTAYFYPRSPRGERPIWTTPSSLSGYFYPRSPRGERPPPTASSASWGYFYPRSPRGERRTRSWRTFTPSYFYPRSPRGERPVAELDCLARLRISIHAPREGSDAQIFGSKRSFVQFLSTLPARGATNEPVAGVKFKRFLSTLPARGATVKLDQY